MYTMSCEKRDFEECGERDLRIGPYARHLSKSIRSAIDDELDRAFSSVGETRLTSVQAHVMGFLYEQRELGNVVYQRDIEQAFHVQRSTATEILKLLEQRNLILRESEQHDARLKRITVTERALQTKNLVDSTIDKVEKKLVNGFSDEEIRTYIELTEKLRRNVEE